MASISKLEVGQTLWKRKRVRCGNAEVSRNCIYPVTIVSMSNDRTLIMASWNGNPSRRFSEKEIKKLLVKQPKPKSMILGMPNY